MDHICICICTYKRSVLLGTLLAKLQNQVTEGAFNYSVVVADNDARESARRTVELFADRSTIPVRYCVEPVQNIALARNKVIGNAVGDFLAFIDDDEIPDDRWLINHYMTLNRYGSAGVLGPVLPLFQTDPPDWVIKGRFFDRPTHPTGLALKWFHTRTGNALLRRQLFETDGAWFDPAYGSGGEDRDFFRKKIEEGNVFIWCNEAPVFELVPPHRWNRRIMLKRALLRGEMASNKQDNLPFGLLGSALAVGVYSACLPLFFVLSHFLFMKYMIKTCDHFGKVSTLWGVRWVKEKYLL